MAATRKEQKNQDERMSNDEREREEGGGAETWRLLSAVSEAAIGEERGSDAVGDVAMGGFEGRGDRS